MFKGDNSNDLDLHVENNLLSNAQEVPAVRVKELLIVKNI